MPSPDALAQLPEPLRSHAAATLGAHAGGVRGVFVESDEDAMTLYALTKRALVRVQALRSGQWQRSAIPLAFVSRIEELFDGATLTVVVEFDADRVNTSLVGATVDGRFEVQGTLVRNGYVLARTPPTDALSAFARALRDAVA